MLFLMDTINYIKIIISLNKLNENCILIIDNLTIKFLIIKIIQASGLYDFRTLLRNYSIKKIASSFAYRQGCYLS